MRRKFRILVLLSVSLTGARASGQGTVETVGPAVPILQKAALPMYPPIARAARITGKVTIRITVHNGAVVGTDVLSKLTPAQQRFLETPTTENAKTWHFGPNVNCQFAVTYSYVISGEETIESTNHTVEILPSLDVNITAHPVKPTVMY